MVRVRNAIFNCINVIPLVLGLSAIAVSIYFSHSGGTACQSSVRNPLLIIGLIFIIVSVFAFLSSCFENTSIFLTIYSILLIFIILALFCVTFFALIISNKALSKKVIGIGVGSLRVKDYSNWLKNNFVDNGHWEEARSCLSDSHICKTLHSDKHLLGFVKHKFSMIQSGCCKPPIYCKFEYKNSTFWEMPKSGPDVPDSDCLTWSNDKNKLCFDCKSCKGGFLDDLRKQWRFLAFVNLGILVIIFIVFNFSCCVRRRKNPAPDGVA
ncbi:tetraspanin-12-like [Hibiscus syriacus]|uniref:tetraspanin-12-like n=1 Tax=Hibiscus syriacus TaxID=106335 RepID=UPI001921F33B|nr:tetraspanin-12-like [Hibiscus syriacus]